MGHDSVSRSTKAGEKAGNGRRAGTFQPGSDPRRNVSTPGTGRPPDWFRAQMGELATRNEVRAFLAGLLTRPHLMTCPQCHEEIPTDFPGDPDIFLKALNQVLDRWMGKPGQEIAVNLGNLTADERRARITELLAIGQARAES